MSNNKIFVLQNKKKKTNHVLHLILTLLTGFWVIVWIYAAISNGIDNKFIDEEIQAELDKEERE